MAISGWLPREVQLSSAQPQLAPLKLAPKHPPSRPSGCLSVIASTSVGRSNPRGHGNDIGRINVPSNGSSRWIQTSLYTGLERWRVQSILACTTTDHDRASALACDQHFVAVCVQISRNCCTSMIHPASRSNKTYGGFSK